MAVAGSGKGRGEGEERRRRRETEGQTISIVAPKWLAGEGNVPVEDVPTRPCIATRAVVVVESGHGAAEEGGFVRLEFFAVEGRRLERVTEWCGRGCGRLGRDGGWEVR